jgi:hypothetical protein
VCHASVRGVKPFRPFVPDDGLVPADQIRAWLLTKVLNAERAAMYSSEFSQKVRAVMELTSFWFFKKKQSAFAHHHNGGWQLGRRVLRKQKKITMKMRVQFFEQVSFYRTFKLVRFCQATTF